MVRASSGHIWKIIALGIIAFGINAALAHGSKVNRLQNTGRDG